MSAERSHALERLQSVTYDLLVIGGGIIGARIAYDAARSGLRTALVDAADFGAATSSASSKLVHGGFRYLANGHVRLVRRARLEQAALRSRVAPGLIRPQPIVLALDREARFGPKAIRSGLHLYSALSGFRASGGRGLSTREAEELVPGLTTERLAGCVLLEEAQTHDGRLTLATIRAAAMSGADVANYVRVAALDLAGGKLGAAVLEDALTGESLTIRFRSAVNASGPWIDEIRRLDEPRCRPITRLSKGVHAVFRLPDGWRAGLAVSLSGNRASFALPWHGVLLVGVTDTPYDGDPGEARPTTADVDELVRGLEGAFPLQERPVNAFAGLRVLPAAGGGSHNAARKPVLESAASGLVSVGGGKLTTHRWIAAAALNCLPVETRPRLRADATIVARGSADSSVLRELDGATRTHLLALYGAEADAVARVGLAEPGGLERIHPDAPDVRAQARYAVEHEWALSKADVARRTTLAIRGLSPAGAEPGGELKAG